MTCQKGDVICCGRLRGAILLHVSLGRLAHQLSTDPSLLPSPPRTAVQPALPPSGTTKRGSSANPPARRTTSPPAVAKRPAAPQASPGSSLAGLLTLWAECGSLWLHFSLPPCQLRSTAVFWRSPHGPAATGGLVADTPPWLHWSSRRFAWYGANSTEGHKR